MNNFDLYNLVHGGGGGGTTVEPITITSNGTVTAPSGKAYSPVITNVPQGEPIEVSSSAGMAGVLTSENVGKAYLFTGATDENYTNGDIYIVEEGNAV